MFPAFRKPVASRPAPRWRGFARSASLPKTITCRKCGRPMSFVRYVPLSPSGIRGYYSDNVGHVVALDRHGVRQMVGSNHRRLFFA